MLAESIRKKLKPHKRLTYVAKQKRGDASTSASKIGGLPWLESGDEWPTCGHCQNPLQFLFQLNLEETAKLKGGPKGKGFLQVFYCTNPDSYCDELGRTPFSPFGKHLIARHYRPKSDAAQSIKKSPASHPLQRTTIVDWMATDDYPSFEDALTLKGVSFTDEEEDFMCLGDDEDSLTVMGEKLMGWPAFIQGADYPKCPTCKGIMRFVFQLSSFGSRIAFLFRCPKHRDKLAFSWQCD